MASQITPLVIVQFIPKGGTEADVREHTRFRPDSPASLSASAQQCLSACQDLNPDQVIFRFFRPTREDF